MKKAAELLARRVGDAFTIGVPSRAAGKPGFRELAEYRLRE